MRHRILCGDFNTPQSEDESGQIVTWADHHRRYFNDWEAAELSILTGLAQHDLPDLFRKLNGYGPTEASWIARTRRGPVGRRFDHVFASESLNGVSCRYVHEWRESGLSDHSAIEAVFAPMS